jgi:cytochrome P450
MELVREKRQTAVVAKPKKDMDILSLLLESNDFSDEDLVDQLLTFLAAGHETTSSTLTWAVYLLAINQDWQTRLRAEIRSNLPARSATQPPTPAEIEALPILNAICNETLRLYPVVPVTVRTAIRPTTISVAGYPQPVPAGTRLLIAPWAINRSPDLWGEKADQFVPNRWLEGGMANTGGATSNYANMTFLHGPRSCIGQGFAKAEFKCLLAVLAGAMKWEMADPGKVVQPMAVVTTKVVDGIKVRMEMVDGW